MDRTGPDTHPIDRRNFLRSAGAGLAAAGAVLAAPENAIAQHSPASSAHFLRRPDVAKHQIKGDIVD